MPAARSASGSGLTCSGTAWARSTCTSGKLSLSCLQAVTAQRVRQGRGQGQEDLGAHRGRREQLVHGPGPHRLH